MSLLPSSPTPQTMPRVMGESAGASSIMHHITAYGGKNGKAPFQRAILQSPGWLPSTAKAANEDIFKQTLAIALTSSELYLVNAAVVGLSPYGSFTYSPTVDGNYVPALPGKLLLDRKFDKSVEVMTAHNTNEGILFATPFAKSNKDMATYLKAAVPSIDDTALEVILDSVYPEIFDGSFDYTDQFERAASIVGEAFFSCNTRYLDAAFGEKSYSYLFNAVNKGFHSEDLTYTFYNSLSAVADGGTINATVAKALQSYITHFVATGNPNGGVAPYFPQYGTNSSVQVVAPDDFGTQITDPEDNKRLTAQYTPYIMSTQARKANSNLDLTGKSAVITGGSQGIGAGVAIRFAQAGANVLIVGRSKERLQKVISEARKVAKSTDQKFDYVSADLSLISGTKAAAKEIEAKTGGHVDYLSHFAVQILNRFHLNYILASSGALKDTSITVLAPGGTQSEFNLNDIELASAKNEGRYAQLGKHGSRDSVVTDTITKSLQSHFPQIKFFHVAPGLVQTDVTTNQDVPAPLRLAITYVVFPIAARTFGNTTTSYADIPVFLAANEGREAVVAEEGYFLDQKIKRVIPNPYATEKKNQEAVFERLKGYLDGR
ncbi:hypothetical protein V502_04146 [Pseudogymnoascus sp. VKM F-4520 (FW-2644)]|nr:hypothetical protein V502_04146 [Pseudogymnoascus sp. VKM F-4520 (FW-2644)]